MKIRDKEIKNFGEPFIIADIGSNHNGDIELGKRMIDAAAENGADSIKFQAFGLDLFSEVCYENDPRREAVIESNSALRYHLTVKHKNNLKKEMEQYVVSKDMLRKFKEHCDQKGILFTCTPFNKDIADFLVDELGMEVIKIASMEVNNYPFLKYLANKQKPIILSTGMASLIEIIKAVEVITKTGNKQLSLLHCVSTYPPKEENVNLNNLDLLRKTFDFPIGWSDHTIGLTIPLASVVKGVSIIEKHFTLDKDLPGWDHKVSATPEELKILATESKKIWKSLGSYERVVPQDEINKRALFRRSIVVNKDLAEGHVLTEEDIDFKRPGIGVEPENIKFIIGRTLKKELKHDDLIKFEDLV